MAVAPERRTWLQRLGDAEAIDRLAGALESRIDKLVDSMLDAYREQLPSYAAAPPSVIEEVREVTRNNIRGCVAILRGNLDFETLDAIHAALARERAEQGFPLQEVLLTYQTGARVFWDAVQEIAEEDPVGWLRVQPVATALTLDLLRHATVSVCTAYLQVEDARVADEEHDLQTLVETLAGLRDLDPLYLDRARRRGIELDGLQWCAVTQKADAETSEQVQALRHSIKGGVVGRIGQCIVAYAPGNEPPKLEVDGPVGVATANDPASGYKRAHATFLVARHLGRDQVRYDEVMPLAKVFEGPEDERRLFVDSQLGRVLKDPIGDDLLNSLEAFYAAGQSVAAAARVLHVHRHTLEYRLERVASLLGIDVRDPTRRLFLELALALRSKDVSDG